MKFFQSIVLMGFLFISCKKDTIEFANKETANLEIEKDSISFKLNGREYSSNYVTGKTQGSKHIDIKPYGKKRPNQEAAYEGENIWFYGATDSLMIEQTVSLGSDGHHFTVGFLKKYNLFELNEAPSYFPRNGFSYNLGKQNFATDFGRENTKDGVYMKISTGNLKTLTSHVPRTWNVNVNNHNDIQWGNNMPDNNIQANSKFSIVKLEKVRGEYYLVEARFELNVYSEDSKLYRVTDGFIRFYSEVIPWWTKLKHNK
ncbi:MAG: hypothetical protein LBF27_19455 [Sphingobacterium sp.]|jgi:hypothetical protein|nr:hypothetical protein [Sphingobacterium sp.]